jgi:hypothetical protein
VSLEGRLCGDLAAHFIAKTPLQTSTLPLPIRPQMKPKMPVQLGCDVAFAGPEFSDEGEVIGAVGGGGRGL